MIIIQVSAKNVGENVMKVAKAAKPKLVQLFENLLWANSPKDWIFKSVYFHGTLFVSMLIKTSKCEQYRKIRRSFKLENINRREKDIRGMATDCLDEIKTEAKN